MTILRNFVRVNGSKLAKTDLISLSFQTLSLEIIRIKDYLRDAGDTKKEARIGQCSRAVQ